MRILQVIYDLRIGGAEKLVVDISNQLTKKGHKIGIVIFKNNIFFENLDEKIKIYITSSFANLHILRKNKIDNENLKEIIEQFNPDIIHTHLYSSELIPRTIKNLKNKFFSHIHWNTKEIEKLNFKTFFNKRKLTNYYEKLILNRYYKFSKNQFIAISNETKEFYSKNLPSFSDKIHFLPNSIDYSHFYNKISYPKQEKIKLINVGNFNPVKNHFFLLQIVKELKKMKLRFELILIGEGELLNETKSLAKKLEIEELILFKGSTNNVNDYLKKSDIYVHTCRNEGFGLAIIEAMASGLPVVTLDGKGNRDFIEHQKNGYIFERQDPKLFSDQIYELKINEKLYNKIAIQGQKTAKNYDIKEYVTKLLELYKK